VRCPWKRASCANSIERCVQDIGESEGLSSKSVETRCRSLLLLLRQSKSRVHRRKETRFVVSSEFVQLQQPIDDELELVDRVSPSIFSSGDRPMSDDVTTRFWRRRRRYFEDVTINLIASDFAGECCKVSIGPCRNLLVLFSVNLMVVKLTLLTRPISVEKSSRNQLSDDEHAMRYSLKPVMFPGVRIYILPDFEFCHASLRRRDDQVYINWISRIFRILGKYTYYAIIACAAYAKLRTTE